MSDWMDPVIERVAKIIDPDAWHDKLPTDGLAVYWMDRRAKARSAARAALDASGLRECVEALQWFDRHGGSIESDVASGHSARGAAASEWMREDDRDLRQELSEALAAIRSALQVGLRPEPATQSRPYGDHRAQGRGL